MTEPSKLSITGVFFRLHEHQSRIVIRRKIDEWNDCLDSHREWDQIKAVVFLLEELRKEDPNFTEKLLLVDEKQFKSSHRTNRYVHSEKGKLYPESRRHRAGQTARKIGDLWLATNLNKAQKRSVILEACDAAGITERGSPSTIQW